MSRLLQFNRFDRRFRGHVEPAAGFGAKLRELRELRGYSQRELGEAIGADQTRVSAWELHRRPELATAELLDRELGAGGELVRIWQADPAGPSGRRFSARVTVAGFGAKLRELRDRRGLSQQELADAIGFSRVMLSNYERGFHKPERDRVAELDRALEARGELAATFVELQAAELQVWLEGLR